MDERRVQAYLSLIQELLRYPSSHEEYILEEHRSLIDTDLLKIMEDMAEVLQAKRKVDEVDKIQAISKRLRNQLAQQDPNWVKYKVARQDHLLFKARKIIDSGIPDIKDSLYSLLSYNLEHLNLYLVTEIDNWIKDEIKKIQKRCLEIDRSIYDELLEYVDWKDPLESLELLGLAGLRKGLELVEAVVFPKPSDVQSDLAAKRKAFVLQEYQEICFLLQHLAAVFQDFNLGDISQNKEISIELINLWLSLVNPSDFPEGWGRAHQKLGSAYYYRIIGNRAENIDAAILSYEKALEIFNKNEFTQDFADIQAELATAYSNRIYGNESQNLERAIFAYRQAIEAQCFLKEAWIEDVFAGGVAMEQYEAFLQEALRLTDESEVNPSVVYPFLARQQDKLSEELIALIPTFGTRNNIIDLLNFANLVQQFRLGQRAVNLEIAIAIYTKALDFFDRQNDATTWANIQNDLGNAYSKRIRGERGENLEQAIRYYEAALTVYTPTAFPEDWAGTQNNLGNAYSNRIRGERGENLEQAIRYYEAALTVYTPTAFPEQWATTQNNLAAAYSNRIRGERGENLEQAIHCYEAALTVRTPTAFPEQWATTQNNLGTAYSNRIRGERGENLEQAIRYYKAALTLYTPTAFPEQWATTQNNLANAYCERIRGERGENLEQAIRYYKAALTVRTPNAYPKDWAMTQICLGYAYSNRIRGERGENLEQAIRCYEAALTIYTPTAFPEQWAMTQNNLGAAYQKQAQSAPAIGCYRAALEIRTPSSFPLDCLQTGRNLGNFSYNRQDWEIAIEGYDNAIRAIEQSRNWATSPQTKQQLLENALPLYGRMIEACLHLERYEQALLTVERSKARTFTELLHNANRLPQNATPTQIQQYEQLNREIAALQYALDDQPPTEPPNPQPGQRSLNLPNPAPQTNPLLTLIQQRQTLLKEINDPTFNEFETVNPQLPDFSQLLTPTTAILEWFLPQDPDLGAYAFLITHQNHQTHIHPHRYSPTQRQALDQFNQTYNQDDRQTSWYEALEERLDHLTQLLDLPQILTHCPDPCYHLILIPHLYLHLYPLHALTVPIETVGADRIRPNPEGASVAPLQDCFEKGVRYAPSCQILAHLQKRDRTQPTAPFFAVQNPTQDLHYADVEIDLIRRRFDPAHILKHAAANKPAFAQPTTRAQLENSEIIHFACHGGFDSTNPLNSGLKLARDNPNDPTRTFTICDSRRFDIEQKDLTAAEIYRNLKLACRLVILSACETGRLDSRTTDEYIGLANALLYAGSNTVVDTRWPVDDGATAFLTIRFYEELTPTRTIPQALKAAQTWFRTITKADFLDWCAKTLQMSDNDLKECQLLMIDYDQDLPFAQRRYWAPFSVSGLP